MAVKKGVDAQKLEMDPAVSAARGVYGDLAAARARAQMTKGQRKKVARDAARSRATYDLPSELIETVAALAQAQQVPASQLAALVMVAGLQALKDGKIELVKTGSRSPLYEFVLQIPRVPDF